MKNNRLESIQIIYPYCTITRECLEYIISGHFTNIKLLKLYLVMRNSKGGAKDTIWRELKNYCESLIKDYKINLR